MPSSDQQPRKKMTKMEKIAELECSLKIAREENKSIKKELHMMKSGNKDPFSKRNSGNFNGESSSSNLGDMFNVDKMKEALKALKRVTVNQEMSLQELRSKANVRRKQLEEKDEMIAALQRNIQSLLKNQIALEDDDGDDNKLKSRCNELQRACLKEENRNAELQEQLDEAQAKIKALTRQSSIRGSLTKQERESLNDSYTSLGRALHRENSSRSMRSIGIESVSTTQELDVAKMKQELAKKSNRIVQLEYELDMVKDEVSELRRKKSNEDLFQGTEIDAQFGGGGATSGKSSGRRKKSSSSGEDAFSSDPFAGFDNDALGDCG